MNENQTKTKMKKEFDLKIDGGTLESIKIDSSNSLMIATYTRDVAEFKAGDILVDDLGPASNGVISIFKCISADKDRMFDVYVSFYPKCNHFITIGGLAGTYWDYIEDQRLATDEEKQLLFDALKKEGLRWNAEKLEIENIKPEFKAGDILIDAYDDYKPSAHISIFKEKPKNSYGNFSAFIVFEIYHGTFRLQAENWDEIKNNRLATEEEKQLLFDALKKEGQRWNAETLEIEELDISEIVVDYESAIKYLGIKDNLLVFKNYDRAGKFNAQVKLQIIADAWNKFDGFEADWENSDQCKYCPMFIVKDGKFEFSGTIFFRRVLDFHTSNFSFKSEDRARQFAEQFIDLFKVALGF